MSQASRSRPWLLHGAAVLSALLATAAWPPFDLAELAWVAWTPWMAALALRPGWRAAALSGAVHFAALHALNCWWFYLVLRGHGGLSPPLALGSSLVSLLGPAPYGLLVGAVGGLLVRRRGVAGLFGLPFAWAAVEGLRVHVPIAVPWALPALTQASRPEVLGVAELFGSHGLSALVLLGNVALVLGALCLFERRGSPVRGPLLAAAAASALVAAGLVYGRFSAQRHAPPAEWVEQTRVLLHVPESAPAIYEAVGQTAAVEGAPRTGPLRVALVQGARPSDVSLRPSVSEDREQARRQLLLSALALSAEPDLLVWAESGYPDTADRMPYLMQGLRRLLQRDGRGVEALVGVVIETVGRTGKNGYTNSVVLLNGEGLLGRYDKRWLVPFGEYIPAADVFFWVERLAGAVNAGFLSGGQARPLPSHRGALGASVCYEAIFPQQQRQLVRNGAELLVNVTNDGWFHGSPAPEQHLRFSALRAVETRRWVVRCANSGVTAVFAPDGSQVGRLEEGELGVLVAEVGLRRGLTLHARTGELPVWAAGLLALAWSLGGRRREELGGSDHS